MANVHTNRKSGFIRRAGVMRRENLWFFQPMAITTLAAANSAAIVTVLNAAALALRPFTVVRTRGIMHLRSDQSAASENYIASLGFAVVSEQAADIGITAVPTPETDRGSDLWFVFESLAGRFEVTTDIGRVEQGIWRDVDSRAMRKVEDGQDLVQVVENSALSAAGSTMTTGFRQLVKLH